MIRILQVLGAFCLCAAAVFLGELAFTVHRLRPELVQAVTDFDRVEWVVGGAARNTEGILREWKDSSKTQATAATASIQATTKATMSVNQAAKAFTRFISRTDDSINLKLLPQVTDTIQSQSAALSASQSLLQANLREMLTATTQLQKTLTDADSIVADPAIKQSIDNLASATESAAGVAKDAKESADMAEAKLKQVLKPASVAKTIFLNLLDFGYKFRSILGF